MKISKWMQGLVMGVALLLATSAFAANKGSLAVSDAVNVGGKQLSPGQYGVKWEGNGPNVEVSITKGKDVVATVPARMVELAKSPNHDTAVVNNNADGSKSITEIRFSGKKYALAVGGESAKAENGDSTK